MNVARTEAGTTQNIMWNTVENEMTDRPILFSGPMVHALLDGRKTQARRVLKPQPEPFQGNIEPYLRWLGIELPEEIFGPKISNGSFGSELRFDVGDRLWVRETWQGHMPCDSCKPSNIKPGTPVRYVADKLETGAAYLTFGKVRQSIFMPRWASRLTLLVDDVKIERVADISHEDAVSEGVGIYPASMSAQKRFQELWDSLNAKRGYGWNANPWVVAITFRVIKQNIDQLAEAA